MWTWGLVLVVALASAFDTGHHFDLTRDALINLGWGEDNAIAAVQLTGWFVDFRSNDPLFEDKEELELMHFDNLLDVATVRSYWQRLATNLKAAVMSERNPEKVLTYLGMSLHAVQDFYSHSNWAESFGGMPNITTFWHTPTSFLQDANIRTGYYGDHGFDLTGQVPHGRYDCGMNKDSYAAIRWLASVHAAYFATVDWVEQTRHWVNNDTFWETSVMQYDKHPDLLEWGRVRAILVSLWTEVPILAEHNGHWKGPGSGSPFEFAEELRVLKFGGGSYGDAFRSLPFVQFLRDGMAEDLTDDLPRGREADGVVGFDAVVQAPTRSAVALEVHVLSLQTSTTRDYFTEVTVDGVTYRDATQMDTKVPHVYWTTVRFFKTMPSTVVLRICLFDEDGKSETFPYDVVKKLVMALDVTYDRTTRALSGDVTGVHNTRDTAAVVTAGNVEFSFFVTHVPLTSGVQAPNPSATTTWATCSDTTGWAPWVFVLIGMASALALIGLVLVALRLYFRKKTTPTVIQ